LPANYGVNVIVVGRNLERQTRSAGHRARPFGGPQQAVPLRQRQKVHEMLRIARRLALKLEMTQ
jgi:hypothetical protein